MYLSTHLLRQKRQVGPMNENTFVIGSDKKKISEFLKNRRKSLSITQLELAKYCNLSREGIQKIESGVSDMQISTLVKMAKILGFKVTIEIEED